MFLKFTSSSVPINRLIGSKRVSLNGSPGYENPLVIYYVVSFYIFKIFGYKEQHECKVYTR